MKTILGLDLGVNSLGWAVTDSKEKKILDTGVRIFPAGINEKTLGMGERELSKNAERRIHRMMRRMVYRRRLRKIKLLELLIEERMCPLSAEALKKWKNWDPEKKSEGRSFPQEPAFIQWLAMNPYELRYRAIHGEITREEFGRILYHLIQRRGFRSSRKGETKEDSTIFKGERGIDELRTRKGDRTLGEYLFLISHKEGEAYDLEHEKKTGYRLRNRYTLRDMYVEEFLKIWEKQAPRLGLDQRIKTVTRRRYMKGQPESKRNHEKLEALKKRFGEENVTIDGPWIITHETLSLKEQLSGKIWEENGRLRYKSDTSILFWQRPIQSQKALLDECRYERTRKDPYGKYLFRGRKPCPVSHPDYEMFRAYQFINNITYGKDRKHLTPEQRRQVLGLMNKKETLKFKEIIESLHLNYEKFNFEDDHTVAGNKTIKKLKSLFPGEIWDEHKYEIWHCFFTYDDNELLFHKLKNDFALKTEDPEKIGKIRLADGYGSLSLKAIRNILPYLEKGYPYSKAVILGGVRNAFGSRWDYFKTSHDEIESAVADIMRQTNGEGEMIRKIRTYLSDPDNNFGFEKDDNYFLKLYHPSQEVIRKEKKSKLSPVENLRNPVVQQGLIEMRRLINSLLAEYRKKYGEGFVFDEIHVEFARDLKISKEQRAEMTRRMRENEEKNREARQIIENYGLRPTRENIQKYLLFKEIEEHYGKVQCPYTGVVININDLLGENNLIQIEHIIPYSVSLDDSFANKTLCESNFNREKGELSPYQFYQKRPDPQLWGAGSWEEVENRAFRILPYNKAKKFVSRRDFSNEDIREGFIRRQLNDTRYISKKAASILTEICENVQVMPGSVTAELRHLWGLNGLLSETVLPLDKIQEIPTEPTPYRVVIDPEGKPKQAVKIKNNKPVKQSDEFLLTGECINGTFRPDHPNHNCTFPAHDKTNGKYWMKITVTGKPRFLPVFREQPETPAQQITLKGKVRRGRFTHSSLSSSIPVQEKDGTYWATFRIEKEEVFPGGTKPQKRKGSLQLVLFGQIENGYFSSYIYKTSTRHPDGPAWIVLDLNPEEVNLLKYMYDSPVTGENELVLEGDINEAGTFVPYADKDSLWDSELPAGRYRAIFPVKSDNPAFYPVETLAPATSKGEKILEGDLWVDKKTGEIRFDPKKSRDDHRHHAIDAITIAFTTRSHLQQLSTYNARKKEWKKSRGERPRFPAPWNNFREDVKTAVDKILVSYRQDHRVLSQVSKRFRKEGKEYRSQGTAARGQLHRETYFGQHPAVSPGEKYYHVRKEITAIENHKHVEKIVDEGIRKLILERLRNLGIDTDTPYKIPPGFFFDENGDPAIRLPNKNGDPVPVRKVRIRENMGNAVRLKSSHNVWVNPYNNHHVLIYRDQEGELREAVVSFWEAVQRRQQKRSLYQLPPDGQEIITTLEVNDMFLLGLAGVPEDIIKIPPEKLSAHLYRVQKISSMYYTFRHHRAANIDDNNTELSIRSFSRWQELKPLKVKISDLGRIRI